MQMVPDILYEDNHLIAVLKPAGLLTQGDISGAPCLLDNIKNYIRQRDRKPGNVYLGMVQRLDRPVSGVIIFAKTSKAAGRLSSQIRNRQLGKLYVAVTCSKNSLESMKNRWLEVTDNLSRARDRTIVVGDPGRSSQHGVLRLKTVYSNEYSSVHLIVLVTGRKHQIRAQLAHRDLPVSGDRKYGSKQSYPLPHGIGLHAFCCRFEHPVSHEKTIITAPLPDSFSAFFSAAEMDAVKSLLADGISEFDGGGSAATRII
jgi:23S rRNA pseudouridine1911/1915/1917 synthase